jgi:pimeloyl-ACP methyl ester carboxylesterase
MSPNGHSASDGIPPHFIVIVPGYMGSKLRDTQDGRTLWVDIPGLLRDPLNIPANVDHMLERLKYPNPDIVPAGLMDQVLFVPPFLKAEHYGRLLQALRRMGYQAGDSTGTSNRTSVYTFAYDWRQDNRISARQLGQAVALWSDLHKPAKAWIIAHSNGGIVSRWYIEKEGGKDFVERLFLMGSPWDGAPKSLNALMNGMDVFFVKLLNRYGIQERIKELIRTFPSYYQLIPYSKPFVFDANNNPVDLFADTRWLGGDEDARKLQEGLRFNQELGTTLSVDTVCFFGRRKPTLTSAVVSQGASGQWQDIEWVYTEAGDGTVPERSAVHPSVREAGRAFAFAVDHGNIYVDPQVLVQLEFELVGRYQEATRATLLTDEFSIFFAPTQDTYLPGEMIDLQATISRNEAGNPPQSNAAVKVQMLWNQALPSQPEAVAPAALPTVTLLETPTRPGEYFGQMTAPLQEGYYRLFATVQVMGKPTLTLEEMISVEAEVD